MNRVLTFAPIHNSLGKKDASGAFQPEQAAFARTWDRRGLACVGHRIDNHRSKEEMRRDVRAALATERDLRGVMFFCHGLKHSIQLGYSVGQIPELAQVLVSALAPFGSVALYACDAARDLDRDIEDDLQPGPGGEGGFADALADEMARLGWCGWVDAHTVAAHTTRNPFVRRFRGTNIGGTYIVAPRSEHWGAWRRALGDDHGTLRLRFPFMAESEIVAEVSDLRR